MDMHQANKAIKFERHVTLTIEEMTGDLNRVKVFTNLAQVGTRILTHHYLQYPHGLNVLQASQLWNIKCC